MNTATLPAVTTWLLTVVSSLPPEACAAAPRPRLAVLTDIGGDPDDRQSLIRLMVYANEFEIEALVASASGTRGELKEAVTRPDLIREIVDGYGKALPNLRRHVGGWPEAESLLRRVRSGNPRRGRDAVGEGHDTEGSRFLIERIDDGAPERPLNVAIWGGQTDLAQALWRVKHERGEAGFREFARKLRVYDINDQDGIAGWMRAEFPGLFYILANAPDGRDKREGTYRGMYLTGDESLTSREWIERNVRATGPLGALYPTKTWTAPNLHGCLKEGDTPSWFFFLPRGGNDPRDPAKPGWGGQFRRERDGWWRDLPAKDGFDPRSTVSRWRADFQTDFATRMAWCRPGTGGSLPRLRVSDNGRFLVTSDGKPFFWLGDTAWHLFGKSSRETTATQPGASLYFSDRAAKGFTVVQSAIVLPPDGASTANADGFDPFEDGDWTRPRLRPGEDDDYWDHVDWCIAEAARHRLYLAAAPLWLRVIGDDDALVRDPRAAYRYGHFLGARYGREPHLVWVLGGDASKGRNVDRPERLALVRALAEGIADGSGGADDFDGRADWTHALMTFHPPGGGHSSSEWLHDEPWLDFHMIQTTTRFRFENWRTVAKDYALDPPKPTLDAEAAYEDSFSLRREDPQDRRIRPWDARRAAYWNVFAGGFGHTYGHRSFIGWIRCGETYHWGAHIPWYESLDAPGASQMAHLRALMESRPFLTRVPDQSVIAGDALEGDDHLQATRDSAGGYAMVYSPSGKPIKARMDRIAGAKVKASWFDPREGTTASIGEYPNTGEREFAPPTSGENHDWVLVLESN